MSRETGERWRLAGILHGMGVIFRRQGNLPRARALLEESHAVRLKTGNAQYIAWGHYALGDVARSEGNWDAARQAYRGALRVVMEASLKSDAAHVLERLGMVAEARGKFDLAARILGAASRLREVVNCTLPPLDQADHEQDVALVRSRIGEAAFELAWADGRRLSLEEAIACGLDV